ncbi:hypothetical protein ECOLI_400105 [Escherichia coli]|nr:hypothetical protein ECOLI_400105 [Escherichia coli]CUX81990.1 hypothetical protein BN3564_40339 [Escherichia coli]
MILYIFMLKVLSTNAIIIEKKHNI